MLEFWSLTPRETYAAINAYQWRKEQQHRRDAWLAWHIAALSRAKRLPRLSQLIAPPDAKPLTGQELERRRQERDEMLQKVDIDELNEQIKKRDRGNRR